MNKENLFIKIGEYIDGELKQSEEESLFAELALDSEARNYLRKMSLLKQAGVDDEVEFPIHLEEKILTATTLKEFSIVRGRPAFGFAKYVSIGISVVLIVISLFLFNSINEYRGEIKKIVNQVEEQKELIKVLYNSLPSTEVRATYSNEIIVKPNS